MKKTILAAAITTLFAATTAHSATFYEKDGVKVDIYGDVEVNFQKDIDNSGKTDDGVYINIDDADFGFKLGHDVGGDWVVGGVVEISAEGYTGNGDSNVKLGDAFVGAMSDTYGTFTVGKQATIFDDAGIGADYQFGFGSFYEQTDSGEQVIKYKLDKGMFYGGIAYLMSNTAGTADNASVVDGKLGFRVAGFDLTAFYGIAENNAGLEGSNLNLEARYTISAFELAAAYATTEVDQDLAGNTKTTDSIGLAATYTLDKAQFAAGYAMFSDDAGSDDVNNYYVNASYGVTDYCKAYAEIGGSDADGTDVGYAVGMQVKF